MRIDGHVALVTGASGGLGEEFVRQLLVRGASKVYAAARRTVDFGDSRVVPLMLDVTDPAQIAAATAQAPDVEILVNNAGASGVPSLLADELADIRDTFEVNVFGPLTLVRAFAPILARGGGAVVNIHSVLSWLSFPGSYAPSKTAFWGVTNALRHELAGQGTQVLGAHFGYVDTPMTAGLEVVKSTPMEIVSSVLDALEGDQNEILSDQLTRDLHAVLPTLTTGAIPHLESSP